MQVAQAIDYLEAVAKIAPRTMSKGMFKFCRSAARRACSKYPMRDDGTLAGYYDPENTEAPRAKPSDFLFPRGTARDILPQSERLSSALSAAFPIPDPYIDCWN